MAKILLVKKDEQVSHMLSGILTEMGHNVECASNFSEAVRKIRDGVDAVITGLYLNTKGETGFGAKEKSGVFVANVAKASGIPRVALTTLSSDDIGPMEKNLLEGVKIVDLSSVRGGKEAIKKVLADSLSADKCPN